MFIADDNIEGGLDYLRENAGVASKARAERLYLEAASKPILAKIKCEYEGSEAARERLALADPRYMKHLEAWKIAVEIDEWHRFKLAAVEGERNAWQTMHKVELAMKI